MTQKRNHFLAGGVLLLGLAGCQQPLVFTSAQTLGVSMAVSTTSTSPIDLVLGYRNLDVSLVPVTEDSGSSGDPRIRGCSNLAIDTTTVPSCGQETGGQVAPQNTSLPVDPAQPYSVVPATYMLAARMNRSLVVRNQDGSVPDQAQSSTDSLSVFSSFNAGAFGGATSGASVSLGKVFATGIAAQAMAQGEGDRLQQSNPSTIGTCLANLATVLKGAAPKDDQIAMCGAGN